MHSLITSLSSANFWPRKCSFIGQKKWKSDGAKSGMYGGCFTTPNSRARSVSTVYVAVWGWTFSWNNNTLFERSPLRFDHIAYFTSFTSMSLYRALVTVWLFSWKCSSIIPLTSQTMVSMNFPAEAWVLNFLLARDDGCFHGIDCLLLSGSKWYTQDSSPVTMWWIKAFFHEHDGPDSPDKSSAMHAYDHRATALAYMCYTLAYTCSAVTHVKFYGNFFSSDSPVASRSFVHRLSCNTNWSPILV